MDYYGNNDWRDYLAHYGTPRHSGRYPWGSGKNPRQGTVGYYQGKGKVIGAGNTSNSKELPKVDRKRFAKEIQKDAALTEFKQPIGGEKVLHLHHDQSKLMNNKVVKDLYDYLSEARQALKEDPSFQLVNEWNRLDYKKKRPFIDQAVTNYIKKYPNRSKAEVERMFETEPEMGNGGDSPFNLYAKSKGTSVYELSEREFAAEERYDKVANAAIDSVLGDYANEPVSRKRKKAPTLSDAVKYAIDRARDEEFRREDYWLNMAESHGASKSTSKQNERKVLKKAEAVEEERRLLELKKNSRARRNAQSEQNAYDRGDNERKLLKVRKTAKKDETFNTKTIQKIENRVKNLEDRFIKDYPNVDISSLTSSKLSASRIAQAEHKKMTSIELDTYKTYYQENNKRLVDPSSTTIPVRKKKKISALEIFADTLGEVLAATLVPRGI